MHDVAVNELYHTHHGDFDESYRTSHTDDVGLMSHGTRIILLSMSHGTHIMLLLMSHTAHITQMMLGCLTYAILI